MNKKSTKPSLQSLIRTLTSSSLLVAALDAQAAVSQSPLSLTVGVPPNLLLTLDDSGSMRWAFAPDNLNGLNATRRAKSASFNPLYYNPNTTYKIPPRFNADGTPNATPFSTGISLAYNNGFNQLLGSYNLSTAYRATWTYDPLSTLPATTAYGYSNTSNRFAANPTTDYNFAQTLNWTGTGTSTPYTVNNVIFTLTRTTSGTGCTANVTSPNTITGVTCTRSSNTYTIASTNRTQTGVPAYYYLFDSSLPSCTATVANRPTDDNCYSNVAVTGAAQQQNFAIWYSFYRNRALATISAASIAFAELPNSTRISWQGLTTCANFNTASSCLGGADNLFREYNTAQRGRLFTWLQGMGFPGGTPLRTALNRAGTFLTSNTAWEKFPNAPGNTPANTYACRPSYHILMTDGIWNGANGTPAGTVLRDQANFNLPDGTSYNGTRRPYADPTTDTLADLAMHYWATDLSNLPNKLKPYYEDKSGTDSENYWNARNNPATWQSMVNFTVGLGLTSSLTQNGLEWDQNLGTFSSPGYINLVNGTRTWPAAAVDSANNVYDLWHAAINSRGEFFSADSPESVVQAFSDIMSRIADRKSVAAKPAINSGQLVEDIINGTKVITVSYQTSYASDDNWSGDLKRSEKERILNSTTGAYEDKLTEKWSAKEQLPAPNLRNIKIKNSTTLDLQAFSWANAGNPSTAGSLANLLSRDPENGNTADTKGEGRLNYILGVRTGEGTTYRTRTTVLGDLYSSSPVSVAGARYLASVANRIEGNTAYTTFLESVKNRSPRVYVGGNDGMLHGFNATTGVEEFAFVPSAVFAKLNKLTGKNYSHEFYVDGSPMVADAYKNGEWRTILVGTLRAGGKGLFALDITTPGSEKLLWEFDDASIPLANTVKMGHSFSQPTVARLHTGEWAVVFGNGYDATNSINGKAALFIVDAFKGTLLKSLEISGLVGTANGLSTPKLSDYNSDGVADYAYAGDLQGNLWRFDLLKNGRDPNAPLTTEDDGPSAIDQFEVGYGAKPLFKAVSSDLIAARQPITSAPSLIRHPSGKGYLVIVGTGKYFEDTDKDGNKSIAQTVYGIWDTKTRGEEANEISITRSNLAVQTIVSQVTGTNSAAASTPARTISNNPIAWTDNGGNISKYGWLLDLTVGGTLDGEMVIENMAVLGHTVLFQTLVPNSDPCADGASNWTYAINPFSGGKTAHHVFDFKDTSDPSQPKIISAIQQDGEGGITASQKPDGTLEACSGKSCVAVYPAPASIGRQSWRQVEEI